MKGVEKNLRFKLHSRSENQILRSLHLSSDLIDFTSNDYLGLARSESLFEKIISGSQTVQISGATGSRLLSGNSSWYQEAEQHLAQIFLAQKALIFNSGYNANLGILSAVPGKGDTILYDEFIHSSLKDGARLSLAQHFSFRHNDLNHLEKKIKISKGNIFVVAESIYSMDGDTCPLWDLVTVCEKYGAALILDEAHSTGIIGINGNGMACEMNLHERIFARIYTFGKAMGIHGACIAGSSTLIDFLINFSRTFIYTTALPPHAIHAIKQAFEHLAQNHQLQNTLKEKITLFKNLVSEAGIQKIIPSNSAIQALIVQQNKIETGSKEDQKNITKRLAAKIQERGFDVRPILSPTVREGSERIRICLHVHNEDNEIKRLVNAIKVGVEGL